jgi:predicted Holliday junction resolvase-like endonuclease
MVVGAVLALLVGLAIGVLASYYLLRLRIDASAASNLTAWQRAEEATIRAESAKRSEAVLRGRITEQLAPFLYDFPYAAVDARFIGNPVDFIIFDGYSEVRAGTRHSLRSIILVDVKTGAAKLTTIERRIKACIEANHVWTHVLDSREVT